MKFDFLTNFLSRNRESDDSGSSVPAASQAPLPADPQTVFIEDFLTPIVANGGLSVRPDRTALVIAYHAFGKPARRTLGPEEFDEQVRAAVRTASSTEPVSRSHAQIMKAWRRISNHLPAVTPREYRELRNWFEAEAERNGCRFSSHDSLQDLVFGERPLARGCLKRVRTYLTDLDQNGKRRSTLPETVEMESASHNDESTEDEHDGEPASEKVAAGDDPGVAAAPQFAPPPPEPVIVDLRCEDAMMQDLLDGSFAEALREQAADIVAGMDELLDRDGLMGLAFDNYRTARDDLVVIVTDPPTSDDVWFIGDIHGDLLGLECTLRQIRDSGSDSPTLILLGDLFDDGTHSYEVVLRVFQLILADPSRICVIAGNHDESLHDAGDSFSSTVSPSDFTDWLNEHREDPAIRRIGQQIVRFFEQAPRALFLPDGLLIAHGGVPHSDLQENIATARDLNADACLQDFVWTRLHDRARLRIPNRTTRGCELGREDFEGFCSRVSDVIGQPVDRMIRGHDHIDGRDRFAMYPRYVTNPVLTINSMCCRLPREVFGPYEHRPCAARWVPGSLAEVYRLDIPPEAVRTMYPCAEEEPVEEPTAEGDNG